MSRISKNLGFTVPPAMATEFEQLVKEEQSTKSEMFRRMFRFYTSSKKANQKKLSLSDTDFDAWVEQTIFEAIEEQKTKPLSDQEFLKITNELAQYGEERAKALGITTEEQINDIVYEERQKRRQATHRS